MPLSYGNDIRYPIKPKDIFALLQEINKEKDLESALKLLTKRSRELLGFLASGIWMWQENAFRPLVLNTETTEEYLFLNQRAVPPEFNKMAHRRIVNNSVRKFDKNYGVLDIDVLRQKEFSGQNGQEWLKTLESYGTRYIVYVPLVHFTEFIGVFAFFSAHEVSFDRIYNPKLLEITSLISSYVNELQMQTKTLEREQALTLLLRGIEILVKADSEEQLLAEAGEMAMEILYLDAGCFVLQEESGGWTLNAPFGRLKYNEEWQAWLTGIVNGECPHCTISHTAVSTCLLDMERMGLSIPLPWHKISVKPLRTHGGIVGELWLMEAQEKVLENRQEILEAFVGGLGVALEAFRHRQALEKLATTDRLTGVLNRQGFEQRIKEEMAGTLRRHSTFLFLFLDLDGFKTLNDTQGHLVGDMALKELAQNLRLAVREEDIVARAGGDEFIAVLTDFQSGPEAANIIERLRAQMQLEKYGLGVTIGVAEFPTEASDYDALYRLADQRLYKGKYAGKGKIISE